MINISEPVNQNETRSGANHPVFEFAFRAFFLLGSFTSIVALIVWLANLNGTFTFELSGLSPIVWHAHEMIFGFAATVAVGFILTAVQTWTGRPTVSQKPLALLILLWCITRVCFWLNTGDSIYLGIALQSLWWLSVIFFYSRIVLAAQNRRNYLFIPLLIVMASLNIGMLWLDMVNQAHSSLHLARTAVMLFTLLMTVVGGRVIPFFTVKGANTAAIVMPKVLEHLVLIAAILAVTVFFIGPNYISSDIFVGVMFSAGLLHFIRMLFWRTSSTFKVPLLWSLHLSYLLMAVGVFLLGVSQLSAGVQVSSALHLITIGGIGLMITSMMSRVSLGHTGRMLQPKQVISWAFLMMFAAAIVRLVFPYYALVMEGWALSVLLWIAAQVIFLLVYIPILTSPRHQ